MLRVLHFLPWIGGGGVETALLQLLRGLRAPDFEHRVVCIEAKEPRASMFRREGFDFVELGGVGSVRNARALAGLVREVRRFRPDVVHARVFEGQVFGALAGVVGRAPAIITEEATLPAPPGDRSVMTRLALRALLHRTDAVVAIAPAVERYLVERNWFPPGLVHQINYGVDLGESEATVKQAKRERAALGFAPATIVFGTVCRLLDSHKRVSDVIRALASLRDQPVALLVVGDGPDRNALEQLAASLGVSHAVRFLGYRTDPAVFFRMMDAFVLTSAFEGFGIVFAEAGHAGLPSIGSRAGGIPDVVLDGETGLLVQSGDLEAIASAMSRLARDEVLRARLGAHALQRARALYSTEQYVEAFRRLYALVVARHGERS